MTAATARVGRLALVVLVGAGLSAVLPTSTCAADHDSDVASSRPEKPITPRLDLTRPDAVIRTASLSSLPRDIVTVPLLKDLLSEDFLFYYETNEDRLGVEGVLRRITYEHRLSLTDEILVQIFNMPAEVALWKGYDGRLSHFAMVVGAQGLAKPLEMLFSVASSDKQLTKAGQIDVKEAVAPRPGVASVAVELNANVYRLAYGNNQKLFLVVARDRLLVFSDEGMALPSRERRSAWAKLFAPMFAGSGASTVFLPAFQAESSSARHSIVVSADYLSFGYQHFFPALKAVKFDMTDKGWNTAALATRPRNAQYASTVTLWKAVPHAPSLCFAVPADASTAKPLLAKMVSARFASRTAQVVDQVESAAAICWFGESKIYTPLVVMQVKPQPWFKDYLRDLFQRNVGGWEAGILTEEQKKELEERKKDRDSVFAFSFGDREEEPIRPASYVAPFPVSEKSSPSGTVWSRVVSSRYGLRDAKRHPLAEKMRSSRYFNVTLAYWKNYVLFSPDDQLVEKAIAALDKQFPPVADALAKANANSNLLALINPGSVGRLVRQSSLDSLPSSQESVFRASVSRYMFPSLEKMNRYGAYALSMPQGSPDGAARWESLLWQELRL